MSEPERTAPDRELADYYDQAGVDDNDWAPPSTLEKPARLDVTISVRFTSSEIEALRARAAAAGLKPTAYIRRSALAAESSPIDRARLQRSVKALSRDLDELRQTAR